MSFYDAIGGEEGIRAVLRSLYDKLFEDPMVGFLFAGKDKDHIVEQQVIFTSSFLGGPHRYTGRSLPDAHAALPLQRGHFDRRHRLLEQVLIEQNVPPEVRRAWLQLDEGLRASVLSAGEDARAKTQEH